MRHPIYSDYSLNSEGELKPNLNVAKRIGQSLGDDIVRLGLRTGDRANIEIKNVLRELNVKIFTSTVATIATFYAISWVFVAIVILLSPVVPYVYSVSAVALIHVIAAIIFYAKSQKPFEADDEAKVAVEKTKTDIKEIFQLMAAKTHEIKNIAVENLNPTNKIRRNPEAFLAGSFLVGIALSAFSKSRR